MTYELLVGATPFGDQNKEVVEQRIRTLQPDFPKSMSPEARVFISSALEKHAGDRPTVPQMLEHPLIKKHQQRRSAGQLLSRAI